MTDRDKTFTSIFWQELFSKLGTQLNLSTAYHPQSDGQTERVNRCVETYLRCMCFEQPQRWKRLLAAAEWWYNTNFHTALKMSSFQALYGYTPTQLNLTPGTSVVAAVDDWMSERVNWNLLLRDNLPKAQNRMKQNAYRQRSDRSFVVGDLVYLKLQPYRQTTVGLRRNLKLSAKYYGPYKVLQKMGPVAYKLELPTGSAIHPVFHVSQWKPSTKGEPVQRLYHNYMNKER